MKKKKLSIKKCKILADILSKSAIKKTAKPKEIAELTIKICSLCGKFVEDKRDGTKTCPFSTITYDKKEE